MKNVGKLIIVLILSLSILAHHALIIVNAYSPGYSYINEVKLIVPAVTSNGRGVTSELIVKIAYPGSGNVYFLTEPLTQLDTQASAKIAALVAANTLNIDFFKYDYFFELRSPSMIIGGPSAGAAMTIAVMAALLNAKIRPNVSITGMIEPNGIVGPVGGIYEKLKAVAERGCKIFLIPVGQRYVAHPVRKVLPGGVIITTYKTVDVVKEGEKMGVKVIEVTDIRQALYYFTGINIKLRKITNKWYEYRLKPPAQVVNVIKEWIDDMKNKVNTTLREIASLKDRLSAKSKYLVDKYIMACNDELRTLNELLKHDYYYEAASSAYRALIYATTAKYLCLTILGVDNVESIASRVNDTIIKAKSIIFSYKPRTIGEFEICIASRLRYYIAEEIASMAFSEISSGTITTDTIYSLATAEWRAKTAVKWLELAKVIKKEMKLEDSLVLKVASTIMYEAKSTASYIQSLVSASGLVEESIKYVEKSLKVYDEGDIYGSIGLALMSLTYSLRALNEAFQIERAINQTLSTIALSTINQIVKLMENKIVPVLSLNYLESAQKSYIDKRINECYMYLTLSSLHAHILNLILLGSRELGTLTSKTTQTTQSTKPPSETITSTPQTITYTITKTKTNIVVSGKEFMTGLSTGLMIGLLLALLAIIYRRKG